MYILRNILIECLIVGLGSAGLTYGLMHRQVRQAEYSEELAWEAVREAVQDVVADYNMGIRRAPSEDEIAKFHQQQGDMGAVLLGLHYARAISTRNEQPPEDRPLAAWMKTAEYARQRDYLLSGMRRFEAWVFDGAGDDAILGEMAKAAREYTGGMCAADDSWAAGMEVYAEAMTGGLTANLRKTGDIRLTIKSVYTRAVLGMGKYDGSVAGFRALFE